MNIIERSFGDNAEQTSNKVEASVSNTELAPNQIYLGVYWGPDGPFSTTWSEDKLKPCIQSGGDDRLPEKTYLATLCPEHEAEKKTGALIVDTNNGVLMCTKCLVVPVEPKEAYQLDPVDKLVEVAREPFEVRSLEPQAAWHRTLSWDYAKEGCSFEQAKQALMEAVNQSAIERNCAYAFVIQDVEGTIAITGDRFPRKYGDNPIPSIESYQENWDYLAHKLNRPDAQDPEFEPSVLDASTTQPKLKWLMTEYDSRIKEHHPETMDVRMVTGLNEGYDEIITHTREEIKEVLKQTATDERIFFTVESATIVAVWVNKDGSLGNYTEPAVVIKGELTETHLLYALLHAFKQSRAAISSDFTGTTWMVETQHCKDPDKE